MFELTLDNLRFELVVQLWYLNRVEDSSVVHHDSSSLIDEINAFEISLKEEKRLIKKRPARIGKVLEICRFLFLPQFAVR